MKRHMEGGEIMKQYSFSAEDLKYLTPLEAVRSSLENQVKTYILNVVIPKLGISGDQKVNYDVFGGVLRVEEPEVKPEPVVEPAKEPEIKKEDESNNSKEEPK